ncbi:MAG: ATP-binding protein [Marinifilaceae bacterium]
MGKDAMLRLKETLLYKTLREKEINNNGENVLVTKVLEIVTHVAPLLERVPENMPEYTLHDPNHSAKVVENMGKFIPSETLNNLNSIELTLLILSGYLHDIGMTCSKDEKENIIKSSEEFEVLFKSDLDKYEKFKQFKATDDHRSATFIEDQIFTEYLRRNHVARSADFIKERLGEGEFVLAFHGIPFWKQLIEICNGHGEPVSSLSNTRRWPRHTLIGEKIINVQFLSLILRLADILDLDPERTPKIIYEFVNPKDPISILEWRKHRSLVGHSISQNKVLFEAECSSPEVERALKEFMSWIELERHETIELLAKYQDDIYKKYFLNLNEPVAKDRIRSDESYISNDLKFHIDYQRVMDLLMGQKLYKNPTVALRELLQNSIDAIKIREALFESKSENFEPTIQIVLNEDSLSVSDNGSGMDVNIFKNFFLQVGKSFYSSPLFYGRFSDVDVTSEFGIGILSTFMVANSLIIESRREPDNPLIPPKPILFEIPTAYSYTIQRKSVRTEIGTTITLKLKSNNPFKGQSLKDILEQLIPKPPYPIKIKHYDKEYTYEGIKEKIIPSLGTSKITSSDYIDLYKINEFSYNAPVFSHKILDIYLNDSEKKNELRDIEGKISLVNTSVMNFYSKFNGYLAQRNFTIGSPFYKEGNNLFELKRTENLKMLFPNWTSFYAELNLTKASCLSITPDRTDIIIDEKFKKLKKQIEVKIIDKLGSHFDKIISQISQDEFYKYTDLLIAVGFLGMDLNQEDSVLSKQSKHFFANYLGFPVLEYNGKITRKRASEIAKCATIGLVNYNWNDDYIKQTLEVIKQNNITLIVLPKMEFGIGGHTNSRFISALLGNQHKLNEPHTVITSCMPSFEIELIKVNNSYRSISDPNNVQSISNEISDSHTEIILMPRQAHEIYPIFNASHSLITPLFNEEGDYKSNEAAELKTNLVSNIHGLIVSKLNDLAETDSDFFKKHAGNGIDGWKNRTNYFKLTKGIFIRSPELMEEMREIFSNHWKSAQKLNIIDDKIEMPEINSKDFLEYWSAV